jgi:hypothetical protein
VASQVTRDELSKVVLDCFAEHFSVPSPSESMTWAQAGWSNDSLDETDFILDLERRLNLDFSSHQETLRNFYVTNKPIGLFVDALNAQKLG